MLGHRAGSEHLVDRVDVGEVVVPQLHADVRHAAGGRAAERRVPHRGVRVVDGGRLAVGCHRAAAEVHEDLRVRVGRLERWPVGVREANDAIEADAHAAEGRHELQEEK